jgi:hypothetical protein
VSRLSSVLKMIVRIAVFAWGVVFGAGFGLFVVFAANGGAAGSSELGVVAWTSLIVYVPVYCWLVWYVFREVFLSPAGRREGAGHGSQYPPTGGSPTDRRGE